jgi:hypothetical protein
MDMIFSRFLDRVIHFTGLWPPTITLAVLDRVIHVFSLWPPTITLSRAA